MAQFMVNTNAIKKMDDLKEAANNVNEQAERLERIAESLCLSGGGAAEMKGNIKALAESLRKERRNLDSMDKTLKKITKTYMSTDQRIKGSKVQKGKVQDIKEIEVPLPAPGKKLEPRSAQAASNNENSSGGGGQNNNSQNNAPTNPATPTNPTTPSNTSGPYTADSLNKFASDYNLNSTQTETAATVLNYLINDMGLTKEQAAGVLGNIMAESAFSCTNAQDSYGYGGIDNPDYNFQIHDGVGYGLIQWTYYSRKQGLLDTANSMNSNVSDINVQLAYLKQEMENNCKSSWDKIKSSSSVNEACDIFLVDIENPEEKNYDTRRKYAQAIYDCL